MSGDDYIRRRPIDPPAQLQIDQTLLFFLCQLRVIAKTCTSNTESFPTGLAHRCAPDRACHRARFGKNWHDRRIAPVQVTMLTDVRANGPDFTFRSPHSAIESAFKPLPHMALRRETRSGTHPGYLSDVDDELAAELTGEALAAPKLARAKMPTGASKSAAAKSDQESSSCVSNGFGLDDTGHAHLTHELASADFFHSPMVRCCQFGGASADVCVTSMCWRRG